MAFRDLAGPSWADHWVTLPAQVMRRRWRGAWPWSGAHVGVDRRPAPPSRRAARARMPRTTFMMLAIGWTSAVAVLLATVLLVRGLG